MASAVYDYIIGSKLATTPLRYDVNYRNYIVPINGKISVKLTPPKSKRYLNLIKDYDHFEFKSAMNPWDVQAKYKTDY